MTTPPRRRGASALIIGVIVVLAALWVGYWFAAHQIAQALIDRVASAPLAGHRIGCTGQDFSGFPLRLDLRCQRATYADAGERVTAALGGVSASAPLYRPGHVGATLGSPLVVNMPALGIALTASWTNATADLTAWVDGLAGASASFVSLAVDNSGDGGRLPVTSLTADTTAAAMTPAGGGDYRLTAAATRLRLTNAGGGAWPDIDGEASVTLAGLGTSLGMDPAATLVDWLRAGATANVERLRVAIAGAVFVADGSLSLTADGLVNGSILLSYNSLAALADLIEILRPGTRERYSMPLQVLNALSKPVTLDEGSFRQTPLTFTDSVIWVGIVPLPDPIPLLRF